MFAKNPQLVSPDQVRKEMQGRALNHEFFLLVRDQKYEEALAVGQVYLHYHPQNAAIAKFCYFIQHNRQELNKMVEEELDYTDDDSEEDAESDEEDEDSGDEAETASVASSLSSNSKANSVKSISSAIKVTTNVSKSFLPPLNVKPSPPPSGKTIKSNSSLARSSASKQNLGPCVGHKWAHICKNRDCPNKKKLVG